MLNTFKNKIKILIVTIFVCFFLGELTIRIDDTIKGHNFFSNEHRDQLIIMNSIVPFRAFGPKYYAEMNGFKYISSSHGELYPLVKPDSTFRIVCFGGSTTKNEWTYEKYKLHYPLILERLLQNAMPDKKIEVINTGNDAYSTAHFLILLSLDVISWSPDLVIISENINDLNISYWKNYSFDYSNKYGTKYYLPDYEKYYTTLNALFRWSSFYWFIKEKLDLITAPSNKETQNKSIKEVQLEKPKKPFGKEPTKLSQYIFRRNLLDFYSIAKEWGIPVLFATQPAKANEELSDYMPQKKEMDSLILPTTVDEKTAHHKNFNNIIKEVAYHTNSYFLDNDSLLGGKSEYFIDAVHYTKEGIEKLASNYFDYIISQHIIDRGYKNVNIVNDFLLGLSKNK